MSILKKPLVTEKFTAISEKLNKVSFIVAKTATKNEIKEAVESVYS
ncbi:MAG: 50S ribosomal protein L23, partial [Bacteroidetes bacterium]|nr:50S ribosomal protein L23 [Bacteroidota bacterium]